MCYGQLGIVNIILDTYYIDNVNGEHWTIGGHCCQASEVRSYDYILSNIHIGHFLELLNRLDTIRYQSYKLAATITQRYHK